MFHPISNFKSSFQQSNCSNYELTLVLADRRAMFPTFVTVTFQIISWISHEPVDVDVNAPTIGVRSVQTRVFTILDGVSLVPQYFIIIQLGFVDILPPTTCSLDTDPETVDDWSVPKLAVDRVSAWMKMIANALYVVLIFGSPLRGKRWRRRLNKYIYPLV